MTMAARSMYIHMHLGGSIQFDQNPPWKCSSTQSNIIVSNIQGLELRAAKEATLQNRKRLAEATREFKRKGYVGRVCVDVGVLAVWWLWCWW